jgi:MFS family permease
MTVSTVVADAVAPPSEDAHEINATYRKITWRLIPFLALLWMLTWIDRVNVGYVKLTMLDELKWSESVYGLGAGIFFIGYFLFEIPSNLVLQKIGAKRTLMRITLGGGVLCVAMAFTTTPEMFYALRFLMGAIEAGFLPGVIVYLTYWYPSGRRAKVFSLITAASALATVVGGPLDGNILNLMGGVGGLSSWQWVFLVEGAPTVLAGAATFFLLTDHPKDAKWLSAREKQLVARDLEHDHKFMGEREHSIFAALKDSRLWLFVAICFCMVAANATLNFYGPNLVRDLGFGNPATIGWIMSVAFLLGAGAQIANGAHSDQQEEVRWHCAGAVLLGAGGLLIVALSQSASPLLVLTGLVIAVIGTSSAFPVFWQMPNRLLSGAAAAVGVALINSIGNLAGFVSPLMLSAVKASTGGLAPGLLAIVAIQLLAAALILWFVPKDRANRPNPLTITARKS